MMNPSLNLKKVNVFKRYVSTKDPSRTESTKRIINQLSVLSLKKKLPELIKLCKEDYIKHITIKNAWKIYKEKMDLKRKNDLKQQYESIKNSMDVLKKIRPKLFQMANKRDPEELYSLEIRVPSDFPPEKPFK